MADNLCPGFVKFTYPRGIFVFARCSCGGFEEYQAVTDPQFPRLVLRAVKDHIGEIPPSGRLASFRPWPLARLEQVSR